MVALTYGVARFARLAGLKPKTGKNGTNGKDFFTRLLEAIAETQMQRAQRGMARYQHLLPPDQELGAGALAARHELPFARR